MLLQVLPCTLQSIYAPTLPRPGWSPTACSGPTSMSTWNESHLYVADDILEVTSLWSMMQKPLASLQTMLSSMLERRLASWKRSAPHRLWLTNALLIIGYKRPRNSRDTLARRSRCKSRAFFMLIFLGKLLDLAFFYPSSRNFTDPLRLNYQNPLNLVEMDPKQKRRRGVIIS